MLCHARYCAPQVGEVEKGENRKCCYELNEGEESDNKNLRIVVAEVKIYIDGKKLQSITN
jgi:hypothetical protein